MKKGWLILKKETKKWRESTFLAVLLLTSAFWRQLCGLCTQRTCGSWLPRMNLTVRLLSCSNWDLLTSQYRRILIW
jgi:hypothetical protein